ncbi:hypothetical protein P879_10236 [Paragonimus westermani]|uniref:Uncharacterized protein n=1 Tax=Paragonimus westermani TaxID=34504 RepID=A0A8T0DCK4_9TREM|nr:hypothetical protein P879_10236 [Paragonimus westermani]
MPREGLSRDQLSQLLLINIGTAADILELFEAFSEEEVRQNDLLRAVILCLWQASLLQFCFNKTAIRERVVNNALPRTGGSRSSVNSVDHPQPVQSTHVQLEALTSDETKPKKKRLKSQCCGQQPCKRTISIVRSSEDLEAQKGCCDRLPKPFTFFFRQRPGQFLDKGNLSHPKEYDGESAGQQTAGSFTVVTSVRSQRS